MKKSGLLDQTLCLNYCAYYKPGRNEELSCKGYDVVERLQQAGKTIVFRLSGRVPKPALVEVLVQKMCMTCDFHEHDCDFMQDRNAPPCGGFSLLTQLLVLETVKMEDIERCSENR
ncbi:MAG TPA: hypothetical protein VIX18_06190 [Nitrospirota bacterium]